MASTHMSCKPASYSREKRWSN